MQATRTDALTRRRGVRIAAVGGERDATVAAVVGVLGAEPDLDVVADRPGRDRALALARLEPDVIVLGRFPERPEFTALLLRAVTDRYRAPVRVIALAPATPDPELRATLRAGAVGFLRADARPSTVLAVVRQAADGSAAVGAAAASVLVAAFAGHTATNGAQVARLTRRERDVLRLVATGLSNAEVAARLVVTTSTVKTHMNAILGKLDLRDRVQATVFAYENGLVRPGER